MPTAVRAVPRRAVVSWWLYDLANTIFSMGIVSLYFSLYVRAEVGADRVDLVYGIVTAISMGVIFFISPLLGAMTDRARRRMPFLVWSTLICVTCTALLARGPFALSALLFVIANAAYQAGLQFYDALLPEVSTPANRGRVGGIGVGLGYIGSYLAVGLGFLIAPDRRALLFTLVALGFLIFALPCFFFVRERGNPNPRPIASLAVVRDSMRETIRTLRSSQEYPGLLRFLIGRIFYTDAVNTVISVMSLYTVNVAISTGLTSDQGEAQARLILMSAITFAIAGGFVWGRIVDRKGPKRTLDYVLFLWMATFVLASSIGILRLPIQALYVVAIMAGIAMGGIQAADRPYMLRLAPPHRIGEFYGLYGMVGRFASVFGPIIWGATTYLVVDNSGLSALTGQALAIATLLVMVVIGYFVLRPVSDRTAFSIDAAAEGADAPAIGRP
jgi:UMF1 family MFS transporter